MDAAVFVCKRAERCSDPRVLNYTSWPSMPGIQVNQLDKDGVLQGSAADALQGSTAKWLRVPANQGTFSVRVQLDEECPLWELLDFTLNVKGVHSFYVRVADETSDKVQVGCPNPYPNLAVVL